ncbi:M23 family metallopeptidase [Paenibacillus sp. 79R4]|uniref:M23 family metallopeptidase n=1 Tax=Paenibacillus sp. 79R4 TaxID=2212847 RepID=UPI002118081F|nr:M23 family metallopeptidase [Paenibacillus sp. 79R4]
MEASGLSGGMRTMDVKSNVKKRREERIRQLTSAEAYKPILQDRMRNDHPYRSSAQPGQGNIVGYSGVSDEVEPDPELLWKRGQGRWQDIGGYNSSGGGGDDYFGDKRRPNFWTSLFVRLMISALIFVGIWGVERYEPDWAFPVRAFVARALTEEIDFGAIEAWYERNIGGAPSFIPIFKHNEDKGMKVGAAGGFTSPLTGHLANPFALSLKGVEIIPKELEADRTMVKSVDTGRVLDVKLDALTGMTVTVQHSNGYKSIYGHLEEAMVSKGDWVEGGDSIGSLDAGEGDTLPTLYFALKKNDRFIDPTDVISFD